MSTLTEIITIILITTVTSTVSFEAYDCTDTNNLYTTISLSHVKPCIYKNHTVNSTVETVQLVQDKIYEPVTYRRCHITMLQHMVRCGKTYDQHTSNPILEETFDITRDECNSLIRSNEITITYPTRLRLTKLTSGSMNIQSHVTVGSIDGEGNCSPGTATVIGNIKYDRPVVSTMFRIFYTEETGTLKYKENKLVLANGVECDFSKQSCYDYTTGHVFWSSDSTALCQGSEDLDVIYEGPATKITENRGNVMAVTYIMPINGYDISIESYDTQVKCQQYVIKTEQPKLYIIKKMPNLPFKLRYKKIYEKNIDFYTFFNTKLSHAVRHINDNLKRTYNHIQLLRCEQKRESYFRFLTLAKMSPQDFAFDYYQGPGYTAVVSGEVIHLVKCKPVEVYAVTLEKCYNDIPIRYQNTTQFVISRSRIIVPDGVERPCSSVLPSVFNIQAEWYSQHKTGMVITKEPAQLDPNDDEPIPFNNLESISKVGIYNEKQIEEAQETIMNPLKRKAVSSNLIRAMEGKSQLGDRYDIFKAGNPEEFINRAAKEVENKFYWLSNKASWWGGMLSFLLLFGGMISLLLKLCNCGINLAKLYKVFGFSLKLIGSVLDAITNCLLYNELDKKLSTPVEADDTTIELEPIADYKGCKSMYPVI